MAEFWSDWDTRGRYRIRLRVWEASSGGGYVNLNWDVALFGNGGYTFYGFQANGNCQLDGYEAWNVGGEVNPSSSWDSSGGVFIASGVKGPFVGNRTITVSAAYDASFSVPSAYGPGSFVAVSGSMAIGGGSSASVPSQVATPTVDQITATQARINWNYPAANGSALDNMDLHVTLTNNPNDPTNAPWYNWVGVVTNKLLTNLKRNTQYYAFVRASNGVGEGAWSPVRAFKTSQFSPPSAPTGYGVSALTSGSAYTTPPTVADNGGSPLTGIAVQYNTNQDPNSGITSTYSSYRSSLFMAPLIKDTQYYFRMRVFNSAVGGGWGPWGAWVPFRTLANTPSAPLNLAATEVGPTSAVLTWDAPAQLNTAVIAGYTLRIATDPVFGTDLQTFSTTAIADELELPTLKPGTTYYAQIWTISDNGVGAYSSVLSFATLANADSGLWLNVDGSQKFCEVWYNDAGTWKLCEPWLNIDGTWKVGVQ